MAEKREAQDFNAFKNDIKRIVSRVSRIDAGELDDQVLIREELGIDSLMSMEILAACEKHLGIRIDESRFADIKKVHEFYDLLYQLKKQGGG